MLEDCISIRNKVTDKVCKLDGNRSYTFTEKLERVYDGELYRTSEYLNKFRALKVRFTVSHPDMSESLVLDATCHHVNDDI